MKQRDGSVLAEFHLSTTEEIKRWILSFGQHAVVLEPQSLRQEMAQELEAMRRQYPPPANEEESATRAKNVRRAARR